MATIIKNPLSTDLSGSANTVPIKLPENTVDTTEINDTQAINPPEIPVTSPQTITPAETPTAPSEPQVFDSNALLGNVQATYDKYGGAAGANEQFIQGVAKLATGRDATPEDLAKGGTISDIINRYNIGEKITGFGITPQATIEQPGGTPSDVSSPTVAGATPTETVATSPVISTIDEMIATKTAGLGEGVDLNYYQQVKTQTATDLENARQDIARQDILDQESLDALEGQGRGIPLGIIQAQQADLSEEQQLDRFKAVQNYNNLSILSQLAAGNFLEAQRINQNVASDMYEIEQLKIEKAKQQGLINEAEQLRLDAENDFKRSLALQGYVKVTDPSKLSGLTEDKIWRDPTNKDIYIKPVEEVEEPDQFTLSAGQVRYDANGNIIAAAPKDESGGVLEAPTIKKFGDNNYQWNSKEGTWEQVELGTPINELNNAQDILNLVNSITSDKKISETFGAIKGAVPPITDQGEIDLRNNIDRLKNLLTVGNLGMMSGVLSETDIKILSEAASNLNYRMSESAAKEELQRIKNKFSEKINGAVKKAGGMPQLEKTYTSLEELVKENPIYVDIIAEIENDGKADGTEYSDSEILQILNGNTGDVSFNNVGNDTKRVAEAIGQFESGGNYSAVGPDTGSGNRAYGKYQVMDFNIPNWTQQALGYSMTPEEFLNNPEAQDAVAQYKMGNLLQQYGNIEDVASVWFSGRPVARAGNAKDVIGTSVPQYVKNVKSIYNKLA